MLIKLIFFGYAIFLQFNNVLVWGDCVRSITTVSGSAAKEGEICSGDIIFEDDFKFLNLNKWKHENTLAGGDSWEFQWYVNNRSNSYIESGNLHIRPTLTSEIVEESFLSSGSLNIHGSTPADECTNKAFYGCERIGSPTIILNPIRSAKLGSYNSFNFKYGKIEIRAKIPTGDWLWPSVTLIPKHSMYGPGPASGRISIFEARSNEQLIQEDINIGVSQITSSLQLWPLYTIISPYAKQFKKNAAVGEEFNQDFHIFQMDWTPNNITFYVDRVKYGFIDSFPDVFEQYNMTELDNPWQDCTKLAPFDQEFYVNINLAVGGITFFPDNAKNGGGEKPWHNLSPTPQTEFWENRNLWLPTWQLDDKNHSSFIIDYIKIYAL